MQDSQLNSQILGIASPWKVTDVKLVTAEEKVTIIVGASLLCVCKRHFGLECEPTKAWLVSIQYLCSGKIAGS